MNDELDAVKRAQTAVNGCASEMAQLRAENRYLRRLLTHNGRFGRILRRAEDDARAMILWRAAGYFPSRAYCYEQGMSERRHAWARGLLQAADLWRDGDLVEGLPPDALQRQLHRTVQRIQASGDDRLETLRRRMPKKFRYESKYGGG